MKKIVIHAPGNTDKLTIETAEKPVPSAHEVVVDVRAIGVNFADSCVRMGLYKSAKDYVGWPITPGFEVAGVIDRCGASATRFRPGQKVMAVTRFGAYASQLAAPENQVFPMPELWSYSEAAGFPTVFLTAYYALFELAHPHPGQTILIHSAAGGVGSALCQLGKMAGCRTVGVVGSSSKIERCPADVVIDKSSQNLWMQIEKECPEGCDIICDPNGAATLKQSYRHLSPGGKLIVYGFHTMLSKNRGTPNWFKIALDYLKTPKFNPLYMTSDNHSVLAFNLSFLFDKNDRLQEAMHTLLEWANEKQIAPLPTTEFPFEQVAEAHKYLESGTSTGKLILTV